MYKHLLTAILALGASIFIASPARAAFDAKVMSIAAAPTEPASGQAVKITVQVKNIDLEDGTIPPMSQTTVDFSDFVITKQTAPAEGTVESGAQATYIYEGYFLSVGSKRMLFQIDAAPQGDLRPSDNSLITDIKVVEPYDLEAFEINCLPAKPAHNQAARIEFKVKNSGYANLKDSTGIINFSKDLSGFTITKETIPTVNTANQVKPGEYLYYRYEGKFTEVGKYKIKFTADSQDQLKEKVETNNAKEREIEVISAAELDLAADSISLSIAKPIKDEEFELILKIKNSGKISLTDKTGFLPADDLTIMPFIPKDLSVSLGDFAITSFTYDAYPSLDAPLDPAKYYQYKWKGKYSSAGTKNISFQFNSNKRLRESNTANNSTSTAITVYKDAEDRDEFALLSAEVFRLSSKKAIVAWTTSIAAKGQVEYKRAEFTSYGETVKAANIQKEQTAELVDLIPGAEYEYKITATNNDVEKTMVGHFSAPFLDVLEITAAPSAVMTASTAQITLKFNLATESALYYKKMADSKYTQTVNKDRVYAPVFKLTGLAVGEYQYYIAATNTAGYKARSDDATFVIKAETTAPTTTTPTTPTAPTTPTTPGTPSGGSATVIKARSGALYEQLKGKIALRIEAKGEAYLVHPSTRELYYLGRPDDAFAIMRRLGVGAKTADLAKMPIGLKAATGADADADGLSDMLEDALGTDKAKADTDGDGYRDKAEIEAGFDPKGKGSLPLNPTWTKSQAGRIFLQVEGKGEAWYVNPADGKRYFLGRPADAFAVMRALGLGVSEANWAALKE